MTTPDKYCPKCKSFRPRTHFSKDKTKPDGLQTCCKSCKAANYAAYYAAHKAERAAYQAAYNGAHKAERAAYRAAHKGEIAATARRRKYGLTPEQYQYMLTAQGSACAICRRPFDLTIGTPNSPHIDHDHDTGALRGLLCGSCNRAIGLLQDSPNLTWAATQYLDKKGWYTK